MLLQSGLPWAGSLCALGPAGSLLHTGLSFKRPPREEGPQEGGILCTTYLLLPEACSSPELCAQQTGGWLSCVGSNEGTLSDPIHQGVMGSTTGSSGPGLCLQPRYLGRKGGFFSSPALCSCSGHSPEPASLPIHITPLLTHFQAQTAHPTLATKHIKSAFQIWFLAPQ